ncbi:hypothetical protein, partial [Paenibacillus alvei]|uniref:hypothetical protein n=1 Tax=Paenibacillus alvei TaxID=44250 RepID=UPI0013D9FB5D
IYMARDILDIPSGNDKLIIALENYPAIREKYRIIWDKVIKEEKEIPQDKERFLELLNKVIYKLNDDLNKEFGTDAKDQLVNDTKWLVLLTGAYLKREWERVKNEAKKGKKAK